MRELSYKLLSLSASASAVSTPECPDLEVCVEEKEKEELEGWSYQENILTNIIFVGEDNKEYKVEAHEEEEAAAVTEDHEEVSGSGGQVNDSFIMRISRSSSFACPQPPRPLNRSGSGLKTINI